MADVYGKIYKQMREKMKYSLHFYSTVTIQNLIGKSNYLIKFMIN